ncbi:MAG TPA: hypothetical protein DCL61_22025 [Cyanobacteria bacterium UBA12227]|nr:hypothetical protein [Cyanobacteria bacterium UBA12227]HAX85288.1 hypothetical protein [Cyanobacteria bacterium UBA11370]HBY79927.1 hypothetical protein [Cyanobacteria bacterium UBA11148]
MIEELDTYDPLADKETLVLYLIQEGNKWVKISSDEPVVGTQLIPLLQMSHDSRPILKRKVTLGERLTYHVKQEGSPWNSYNVVPSEWVVVKVTHYEPSDLAELPDFRGITIAYCERQPLSPEEIERMSYEIISKVSVDSFGGDEDAYQRFLESEESHKYVRF